MPRVLRGETTAPIYRHKHSKHNQAGKNGSGVFLLLFLPRQIRFRHRERDAPLPVLSPVSFCDPAFPVRPLKGVLFML
jgi:hypothetical protein